MFSIKLGKLFSINLYWESDLETETVFYIKQKSKYNLKRIEVVNLWVLTWITCAIIIITIIKKELTFESKY